MAWHPFALLALETLWIVVLVMFGKSVVPARKFRFIYTMIEYETGRSVHLLRDNIFFAR